MPGLAQSSAPIETGCALEPRGRTVRPAEEVIDIDEIVGIGGFCAVLILLRIPAVQRRLIDRARRAGHWLVEQLKQTETVDPAVEELRRVIRNEWLRAQRARLQRLLVDDAWMSATRQFGNRLAYAWVLDELEQARLDPDPLSTARAIETSRPGPDHLAGAPYKAGTSGVEVLDVGGWGTHRTGRASRV